jgi:uncharacterized membrane protein
MPMTRWQWVLRQLTRRMWIRASLFCVFGVGLALIGALVGPAFSYDFATKLGSKSVDEILNVLASSMLAVTTFSLTAMVSAYSGAATSVTPRAVQLLIDDSTSQNALATFLGSFLFAIVGIVALSTGFYGETGRVILFAGTILVIAFIVVTFVRWIEHIARFGRMQDTIDRVERAATLAAQAMDQRPRFGPRARLTVPDHASTVRHSEIGRVNHVDLAVLSDVATEIGADIHLAALPGTLVDPARLLAWCERPVDEKQAQRIRNAFSLAHHRVFDNDPRFGLVVLSEIASRALSPAVNDPGTAIAVIEAGTRALAAMLQRDHDEKGASPPNVRVPAFAFPDLIEDLYRPIARDGAGVIEVGVRLQKALAALQAIAPEATGDCRKEAADAVERASEHCSSAADCERLERVHMRYWPATVEGGARLVGDSVASLTAQK